MKGTPDCAIRFLAPLLVLSGLMGCGSSSTGTSTPAAPVISSFSANPSSVTAGGSASLKGVFSNGTGNIAPGNITVTSGTSVSVTVTATTTYTLKVTNSAGASTTATATVTVTPPTPLPANLGVNIGWVNDWDRTQMFADAMKQARKFGSVNAPYDETASVDSLGWPTQDAGVAIMLGNQGAWSAGTYALSFTGQAHVQAALDANVSIGAVTYNGATNSSTATVTVAPAYVNLYLVFTNTKRTPTSATGSGVTNVSLMRPTINGSPHAAGTLFTDRFLARLKYFSAIRMKDYEITDSSSEAVWADRAIPAHASQQQVPPHASQNVNPQYITGACTNTPSNLPTRPARTCGSTFLTLHWAVPTSFPPQRGPPTWRCCSSTALA